MYKNEEIGISIIIPTFNRSKELKRAIKSVVDQTYTSWELLIIDNYSTDDTQKIVDSFRDNRISLIQIENSGVVAMSRNKGIEQSKGKYLAFLDSDDWWVKEKLQKSIEFLESGSDIVYHDLKVKYEDPFLFFSSKRARTRELESPIFKDLMFKGNAITNSSVVVRKSLIQEINGFSEDKDMVGCEDFDGWIRLSKLTERFKKINSTLGFYSVGTSNLSSHYRSILNIKSMRRRYIQYLGNVSNLPLWVLYKLARANNGTRDYSASIKFCKLFLKEKSEWSLKIKIIYTLFNSIIRHNFNIIR